MICLTLEGKRNTGLDDLTDEQWADIDRLLMIVWKTRPLADSAMRDGFADRECTGTSETSREAHLLRACG